MKTVLSVVLVLIFASVVSAQPHRGGKFGVGEGKFGDPAQITLMRHRMRQALIDDVDTEKKQPGPPPWAGKGMRLGGQRGPQPPFLGRSPLSRTHLRRGHPKDEVSGNNFDSRERRRRFDNQNDETKRGGIKSKKFRGNSKISKVIIININ